MYNMKCSNFNVIFSSLVDHNFVYQIFLRVKSECPQNFKMDEETVLNPPVRDAELVLCYHCNEKITYRNLARHNSRNHSDKEICWTVPHLKIRKLSSFFKPKNEDEQKRAKESPNEENVQNESVNKNHDPSSK